MSGNRDNYITCYNCGAPNIAGVRACTNCNAPQYYNCPYCNAWVDNSFSNCPNCGDKLKWPSDNYTEYAFSQNKSTSSAVVVLLLSVVLLSIVAVNLMINNSNPVDAIARTPAAATPNNTPLNELKVTAQPEIQYPPSITASPSMTQSDYPSSYTEPDVHVVEATTWYQSTTVDPVTPAAIPTTDTYVPKRSSYLETMYPNWGRCSGGSCRGYYQ